MTELFEIKYMITDLEAICEDMAYEADSKPGEGLVFVAKLLEAKKLIDKALVKLNEAAKILVATEGQCKGKPKTKTEWLEHYRRWEQGQVIDHEYGGWKSKENRHMNLTFDEYIGMECPDE